MHRKLPEVPSRTRFSVSALSALLFDGPVQTSFPSMRVATPTAPSAGGTAPFSGSNRGVSGTEGVFPSSTAGVEGTILLVLGWDLPMWVRRAYREMPNWTNQR